MGRLLIGVVMVAAGLFALLAPPPAVTEPQPFLSQPGRGYGGEW